MVKLDANHDEDLMNQARVDQACDILQPGQTASVEFFEYFLGSGHPGENGLVRQSALAFDLPPRPLRHFLISSSPSQAWVAVGHLRGYVRHLSESEGSPSQFL